MNYQQIEILMAAVKKHMKNKDPPIFSLPQKTQKKPAKIGKNNVQA